MKNKEWITDVQGKNLKFKRETLLNYAMNRWGLNKSYSVGTTSELIRNCAPSNYEEWIEYYFEEAYQKKKGGAKITKEYIIGLGQTLYIKLSEVVQSELISITEKECIDYAYNLVLNRTYEGYLTEIDTIYGQLQGVLGVEIEPAPDKWDRTYGVDFRIPVGDKYIGIQIKPVSGQSLNHYQWIEMHEKSHQKFFKKFGGHAFFVYSIKDSGKKKKIHNPEVIGELKAEIERLKKES